MYQLSLNCSRTNFHSNALLVALFGMYELSLNCSRTNFHSNALLVALLGLAFLVIDNGDTRELRVPEQLSDI